jgi:hypothetical protein
MERSPVSIDAETVIARLEEAGRALLSLPNVGPSTRLVQSGLEWVRDASDCARPASPRIWPSIPDAATIDRMDQALAWIPLIPVDRYVLRRVVGARSLINPMTDRYLYTWRRLALAVGADHKAVQRWHAQGIDLIVAQLSQLEVPTGHRPSLPPRSAAIRSVRRSQPGATGRS